MVLVGLFRLSTAGVVWGIRATLWIIWPPVPARHLSPIFLTALLRWAVQGSLLPLSTTATCLTLHLALQRNAELLATCVMSLQLVAILALTALFPATPAPILAFLSSSLLAAGLVRARPATTLAPATASSSGLRALLASLVARADASDAGSLAALAAVLGLTTLILHYLLPSIRPLGIGKAAAEFLASHHTGIPLGMALWASFRALLLVTQPDDMNRHIAAARGLKSPAGNAAAAVMEAVESARKSLQAGAGRGFANPVANLGLVLDSDAATPPRTPKATLGALLEPDSDVATNSLGLPLSIPADDSPTPTRATPRSSTPRVALTKTPPPALSPVSPTSRRDPRPRSPLARNSATQGASNRSPFAEDGTPAMELGGSQSHSQSHSPSLSPTSAGGHEGQGIAGDGEGARDAWGGEGKGNGGGAEGVGSARRRVAEWRPAQGNAAGDLAELERCPLAQMFLGEFRRFTEAEARIWCANRQWCQYQVWEAAADFEVSNGDRPAHAVLLGPSGSGKSRLVDAIAWLAGGISADVASSHPDGHPPGPRPDRPLTCLRLSRPTARGASPGFPLDITDTPGWHDPPCATSLLLRWILAGAVGPGTALPGATAGDFEGKVEAVMGRAREAAGRGVGIEERPQVAVIVVSLQDLQRARCEGDGATLEESLARAQAALDVAKEAADQARALLVPPLLAVTFWEDGEGAGVTGDGVGGMEEVEGVATALEAVVAWAAALGIDSDDVYLVQLPSKSSLRGQSLRSLPHPNLLRDLVRAMFRSAALCREAAPRTLTIPLPTSPSPRRGWQAGCANADAASDVPRMWEEEEDDNGIIDETVTANTHGMVHGMPRDAADEGQWSAAAGGVHAGRGVGDDGQGGAESRASLHGWSDNGVGAGAGGAWTGASSAPLRDDFENWDDVFPGIDLPEGAVVGERGAEVVLDTTLGGELVCSDASSGCDDSDDAHEHHPIATSIYSGVRARAPIPGLAHDVSTASEPPMRSPAMPGVDRGAWRAGKRESSTAGRDGKEAEAGKAAPAATGSPGHPAHGDDSGNDSGNDSDTEGGMPLEVEDWGFPLESERGEGARDGGAAAQGSGGARRSLDAHGSRTASSEVPRRPESVLGQSGLGQGAVRGASEARGVTRVSSTGTDRDEEAWLPSSRANVAAIRPARTGSMGQRILGFFNRTRSKNQARKAQASGHEAADGAGEDPETTRGAKKPQVLERLPSAVVMSTPRGGGPNGPGSPRRLRMQLDFTDEALRSTLSPERARAGSDT